MVSIEMPAPVAISRPFKSAIIWRISFIVQVVAENAQGAAHGDLLGDDVVRRAADYLAEGQKRVLMRVNIACYYRLDHRYELGRDDDGVNAHLRRGRVRTFAVHLNLKIARLCHEV